MLDPLSGADHMTSITAPSPLPRSLPPFLDQPLHGLALLAARLDLEHLGDADQALDMNARLVQVTLEGLRRAGLDAAWPSWEAP